MTDSLVCNVVGSLWQLQVRMSECGILSHRRRILDALVCILYLLTGLLLF